MILSAFGFSLMAVCVKLASGQGIPVLEIVAARALVSLFLSYIAVRRKGISLLGHKKHLLLSRGVVGALALMCVYYAITHLPLAEATVLQYLHPMFTAVLAFAFLKERIQASTLLSVVFSFIGIAQQQVTATSVGQYIHIRQKLLASWVAENKMTEIKLSKAFPETREHKEELKFANEEWQIVSKVKGTTDNPDLRVVDIEVHHIDTETNEKDRKFVLTGYMGAF